MIVTDDEALAARCDELRDPEGAGAVRGRTPSYADPLQAALLTARLPKLDDWRAARAANADAYRRALGAFSPVVPAPGVESTWYSFVVRIDDRDAVKAKMLVSGVETKIEYATPVHLAPSMADLGWRRGDFPVAEEAAARGLSLPVHPFLAETERAKVIRAFRGAVG